MLKRTCLILFTITAFFAVSSYVGLQNISPVFAQSAGEDQQPVVSSEEADINQDGVVDILDQISLQENFGEGEKFGSECDQEGDMNGDCDVDIFDYRYFLGATNGLEGFSNPASVQPPVVDNDACTYEQVIGTPDQRFYVSVNHRQSREIQVNLPECMRGQPVKILVEGYEGHADETCTPNSDWSIECQGRESADVFFNGSILGEYTDRSILYQTFDLVAESLQTKADTTLNTFSFFYRNRPTANPPNSDSIDFTKITITKVVEPTSTPTPVIGPCACSLEVVPPSRTLASGQSGSFEAEVTLSPTSGRNCAVEVVNFVPTAGNLSLIPANDSNFPYLTSATPAGNPGNAGDYRFRAQATLTDGSTCSDIGIVNLDTPTATPTPPPCSCIMSLTPSSADLNINESVTLTAGVNVRSNPGRTCTVDRVNFASRNNRVASVNPGLDTTSPYRTSATALALGQANISSTATLSDGQTCSDISTINVSPTPTPPPACAIEPTTIRFENVPGAVEETEISDQFRNAYGVRFTTGNTQTGACETDHPLLTKVGKPLVAYVFDQRNGQLGEFHDDGVAVSDQDRVGQWFITDDGLDEQRGEACIMNILYDPDYRSYKVSLDLLDLDSSGPTSQTGYERFVIQAFDNIGNKLDEIIADSRDYLDRKEYDGKAFPVSLVSIREKIARVTVTGFTDKPDSANVGFGLDNITVCEDLPAPAGEETQTVQEQTEVTQQESPSLFESVINFFRNLF